MGRRLGRRLAETLVVKLQAVEIGTSRLCARRTFKSRVGSDRVFEDLHPPHSFRELVRNAPTLKQRSRVSGLLSPRHDMPQRVRDARRLRLTRFRAHEVICSSCHFVAGHFACDVGQIRCTESSVSRPP